MAKRKHRPQKEEYCGDRLRLVIYELRGGNVDIDLEGKEQLSSTERSLFRSFAEILEGLVENQVEEVGGKEAPEHERQPRARRKCIVHLTKEGSGAKLRFVTGMVRLSKKRKTFDTLSVLITDTLYRQALDLGVSVEGKEVWFAAAQAAHLIERGSEGDSRV